MSSESMWDQVFNTCFSHLHILATIFLTCKTADILKLTYWLNTYYISNIHFKGFFNTRKSHGGIVLPLELPVWPGTTFALLAFRQWIQPKQLQPCAQQGGQSPSPQSPTPPPPPCISSDVTKGLTVLTSTPSCSPGWGSACNSSIPDLNKNRNNNCHFKRISKMLKMSKPVICYKENL